MTEDDDFVFTQMLLQILSHLDPVLGHAINGHCGRHRGACLSKRSASTPLVPLHHREVLFPRSKKQEGPGIGDVARPAVQKQQHGTAAVLAANCDPLLDTANSDVAGLVNAL